MSLAELDEALRSMRDELDRIKPVSDQLEEAKGSVSTLAGELAKQCKSSTGQVKALEEFVGTLSKMKIPGQLTSIAKSSEDLLQRLTQMRKIEEEGHRELSKAIKDQTEKTTKSLTVTIAKAKEGLGKEIGSRAIDVAQCVKTTESLIIESITDQGKRNVRLLFTIIALLALLSVGSVGLLCYDYFSTPLPETVSLKEVPAEREVFSLVLDDGRAFGPFRLERGAEVHVSKVTFLVEKLAKGYELRSVGRGERYGPFELREGETVAIGNLSFKVER
jgi:hypothetical protein